MTTNSGDDTLSIINPDDPNSPVQSLPVGLNPVDLEGPHHLVADPGGRYVYVNLSLAVAGAGSGPHGAHGAGDEDGYVLKLDTATGREVARVRVAPNAGDSALTADGKTLYVSHYDVARWRNGAPSAADPQVLTYDSDLYVIDAAAMAVMRQIPLCPAAHGVRLARDESTLFATCGPDQLAVVDLTSQPPKVRLVDLPGAQKSAGATCARCPYAVAVAPDDTVWVSGLGPGGGGQGGGRVEVFDPKREGGSFDPARGIAFIGSPVFASFVGAAADYQAIVPEQGGLRLPEESLRRFRSAGPGVAPVPLAALPLDPTQCFRPHMMLVDATWTRGHLICEGDHVPRERGGQGGDFVWVDLAANVVTKAVRIGVFADGMALVPARAERFDAGQ